MVLRVRVVVPDASRRSDGGPAISAHVPRKAKPGCEFPPIAVAATCAGKAGISRKGEAKRRLRKDGAPDASRASLFAICRDSAIRDRLGQIRFPAQAVVQGPSLIQFPGIGQVQRRVPLPHIVRIRRRLHKLARPAEQKVRQRKSGKLAAEGE